MLERARDVAREAALEAGAAIRGFYNDEYTVRDKGEDNPLTDADLAADKILERHLRTAFPDFGWLSEETADTPARLEKSHVWIVDPLDGTREFTLGIPEFVVSVGLVIDGRAVVGVLYFGRNDPANFGSLERAMLTLFQVSEGPKGPHRKCLCRRPY